MPVAWLVSGSRAVPQFLVQSRPVQNAFSAGRWTLANKSGSSTCTNGGTAHKGFSLKYRLPQPIQDPITVHAGRGHYTVTGGSPFDSDFDSRVQRTGD